ncbi:hypothetical protein D9757_004917 [Collybiopsis confluens]|uniref:Mediator of RNA polymerase II transcription subunit 20 n=1 Tax=Collybiopsis confluens TaxID=2823264 RepID=A0A8H5HTS0_9AGAR|nr:hypothetical protein D9757_004917 [Collybiopsis confluens]
MGLTGLARWINAPPDGLLAIRRNILENHSGHYKGPWNLAVKSYRSTLTQTPGFQIPSERTMFTLQMYENVFVLLEDPLAPTRADVVQAIADKTAPPTFQPTHYRTTFLTLNPPGALEQLLAQLKARWVPVRQGSTSGMPRGQSSGYQLTIEGGIFGIGSDWLIRAGIVTMTGGEMRGMLLEAEYLPLPGLNVGPAADGTSELLSNLLTSILPNVPDAKTVAVTISDAQWEDVLWDREEEERALKEVAEAKDRELDDDDDTFVFGDEDIPVKRRGDWTGVDRDRRSAFLIIGALKSEGIL